MRPPTHNELTTARGALAYARELGGRFPEGEAVIVSKGDSYTAYVYARDCLFGPFPAGEALIAESADFSHSYAKEVLHGRFPAGELAIANTGTFSRWYVADVLRLVPSREAACENSWSKVVERWRQSIFKRNAP